MSTAAVPAVTIVLASFGRLPLLQAAIASALAQDHGSFDVLVVDDGSDEATREWLRLQARHDPRVHLVFQAHQGVAAARARGVAEAQGGFVCILDSDDVLEPGALSRLCELMERDPATVIVHTPILEIRPDGAERRPGYPVFTSAAAMLRATLVRPRVPFKHSGTMFRRSVALQLGSYDPGLPCKVDVDLYLKFLAAGHLPRLAAEPLVRFRMHADSVSRDRLLGIRVWFRLIDRYGPRSALQRTGIKLVRAAAELFKGAYMSLRG